MARWHTIEGIRVDIESLRSLSHNCRPAQCGVRGACCRRYEVALCEGEADHLAGMLPLVAPVLDWGRVMDWPSVFDVSEDGTDVLETGEDGLCVLALKDRVGRCWCGLHTAALASGLVPMHHKPRACALWPLAESDDGTALSVVDDAFELPCNRRRPWRSRSLSMGVRSLLASLYGPAFADAVEACLGRNC